MNIAKKRILILVATIIAAALLAPPITNDNSAMVHKSQAFVLYQSGQKAQARQAREDLKKYP